MLQKQSLLWVCLGLMLLILAAPFAAGQATNASITGLVTDASSAAVPNATVTVTNSGTGISRSVTTNDSGSYTIGALIPGT